MGIPDHLTCLLRNMYAGQEATVRSGAGTLGVPLGGTRRVGLLIPACASSSLAFHMTYSAYKLKKQGDNIQP